jgi:lipopolysaccharide export system ATP-binding protein
MTLLQCDGLVKDYPGKRAVDGVSFDVSPGEIVGLLGPNGAGKSTTFRMACGLGYLPQDQSIFSKLSVEDNIFAITELRGESKSEAADRIDRLLFDFGLDDKRHQQSGSLSGGERRRLEIARSLASDPEILLLDEPFTGIDPTTIHSIQDIIRRLKNQGIAILMTDHRERELLTIADRSYIIGEGKVIISGDAETVLSNPDAIASYFGKRFDAESIIAGRNSFRKAG